jgi:hypothetical protein
MYEPEQCEECGAPFNDADTRDGLCDECRGEPIHLSPAEYAYSRDAATATGMYDD